MNIQNKKQWFLMLNELADKVKLYENTAMKYNCMTKSNIDFSRPLLSKFYKKNSIVNYIFKTMLKRLPIAIICAVITWIALFIVFLNNASSLTNLTNLSKLFAVAGASSAGKALTFALISLFGVLGIIALIAYLNIKNITKKLDSIETEIMDNITTVPPSYRNSEKLLTLANIYFTKQSLTLKAIFEVCDEWLLENATSKFHSIMFDINYKPIFDDVAMLDAGTTDEAVTVDSTDDSSVLNNPNLPADIESKTFAGSKDSKKDLDNMIGLESVKQQITKLENRIKFYGNSNNNGNHMAFLGSAGTGKTSVARIITKILFDLGYIKKNQYVEISGDYLKASNSYRASAIIDYAMGGVLFIDEAYLLYDKNGNSADATGILLKAMEDHRSDFVVILAGYEEQMTKLLASNEGFGSRIKHTIYFPDYTVDEMVEIFNYFISNYNGKHYELDVHAYDILRDAFDAESKSKSFGNARTVRNAVDAIMDYYADRCINTKNKSNKILEEDVNHYYDDRKKFLQHELKNASAANQIDESIIRLSELKPKLKDGSENPEEELNSLIGMDDLKQEIEMLKNQKEFYNEIQHQKILMIGECNCKDVVMRALTGSLYSLGYITENKYLDISADFMKGSYVGHTNKRAESIISYASGGVLVISGINLLVNSDDNFSQEVISIIVTALNENPDVTLVILDNDSEFINSLKTSCTIVYEFPNYNTDQMYQIFEQLAVKDGFSITEDAANKTKSLIENSIHSVSNINNFYNIVKKNHIANFNGVDNKFVIVEEDISLTRPTIKLNLNKGG